MLGSFKARCIEADYCSKGWITVGKIYEIKNGSFQDDEGDMWGSKSNMDCFLPPIHNIKDLNEAFDAIVFEEVLPIKNNKKLKKKNSPTS